jgi:hypothetical protein
MYNSGRMGDPLLYLWLTGPASGSAALPCGKARPFLAARAGEKSNFSLALLEKLSLSAQQGGGAAGLCK